MSQLRKTQCQTLLQARQNLRSRAIEVHRKTLFRSSFQEPQRELRTIDPAGQIALVNPIQRPAHGLTIRHNEIERVQAILVLLILYARHHAVHRERRYGVGAPFQSGLNDARERPVIIDRVHQDSENTLLPLIDH